MDTAVSTFVKSLPPKRTLPGTDYITVTDNEPEEQGLVASPHQGLYYREKGLFHIRPAIHERQTSGAPGQITPTDFFLLR